MRITPALLLTASLFTAGCGNGTTAMDAGADLSTSVADLSVARDLSPLADLRLATDGTLPDTDIRDLQDKGRPGFVPAGTRVSVGSVVVTARKDATSSIVLFVQEPSGAAAFSGLMVFIDNPSPPFTPPAVGDLVTIDGTVNEFARMGYPGSRTNIDTVTGIQILGTQAPPAPTVVAEAELVYMPTVTGDDATSPSEKWEGVLVQVNAVTVTTRDPSGEVTLNAGLKIDDRLFAYPQPYPGDTYTAGVGPLEHDFGTSRLLPRDSGDLVGYVAAPPRISLLSPPALTVGQGETGTLTVTVDRPAPGGGTVITLDSTNATIAAPATTTVTVAAGMTTASFDVNGVMMSGTPVNITAALGGTTLMSAVTVGGPTQILSLGPTPMTLSVNGTGILTIMLDRVAPSTGRSVTLMSASGTDVAVPASVTVPAGQSRAGFRIRAGAATTAAPVVVTATLPSGPMTANVNVVAAAVAPAAAELVFNEINIDPAADAPGTATVVEGDANCDGASTTADDEFVEISNVSAKSLQLTGVGVWDAAAMNAASPSPRFIFPSLVLGPGESVLVFGGSVGSVPTTSPWCTIVGGGRLGDAVALAGAALGLNNGGNETVYLTATKDKASLQLAISMVPTGKGTDQSYARDVDFTGAFADYTTIAGRATDRAFTPGTRVSGLPFASASAP